MNYILYRLKSINIPQKMIIIILFSFFVFLSTNNTINELYNIEILFIDAYKFTLNDPIIYYIPVVMLYFYFINHISQCEFERKYVYRFKFKNELLKINIIINFIFTIIYIFSINILISLFLAIKFGLNINSDYVTYLATSCILQILVLYIYNLLYILFDYVFVKNKLLILSILNCLIILTTMIGTSLGDLSKLLNISLYTYFTVENIILSGKITLFGIMLLVFTIFLFTNILHLLINKLEYTRYLNVYEDL